MKLMDIVECLNDSFRKIRTLLKIYNFDVEFDKAFSKDWIKENIGFIRSGRKYLEKDNFEYTLLIINRTYNLSACDYDGPIITIKRSGCFTFTVNFDYTSKDSITKNNFYGYPILFSTMNLDIIKNTVTCWNNDNDDEIYISCDDNWPMSFEFSDDLTGLSCFICQPYPTQLSAPLIIGTELGGESSLLLISPISSIISSMMYI